MNRFKNHLIAAAVLSALAVIGTMMNSQQASAQDDEPETFRANLSGYNEVVPISTDGTGTFEATVNGTTMTYTETFSNLTSPVTQSHIHFAQPGVIGGVVVFLCTNLGNGPAGTPACPAGGGTVTRTITGASVLPVSNQHISAGDFAALVNLIRAGDGYVNVATTNFPAGEIRGQIKTDD